MPAGKLNLTIEQGATYRKTLLWKDSNKTPINLAGYTAHLRVIDPVSGATLLDLTTANGGIVLSSGGSIEIVIAATATQSLTFKPAVYDLKLVVGTEEIRLVEGHAYVSPAVTPRGV